MCYFVCTLQYALGLKWDMWVLLSLWCKCCGDGHQGKFRFMNASLGLYMMSLSMAPKVLYVVKLVYLISICISPPELDQVGCQLWVCLLPFLCLLQPDQISKLGKTYTFMGVMFCSDSQRKAPGNQRCYEAKNAEAQKPAWFWSVAFW